MAREFERLRALPDDLENFRMSAELENNFMAKLDGGMAASLVQRMPGAFIESYFGGLALHKWATADRASAAAWMTSHPSVAATTAQSLAGGWFAEDSRGLKNYLAQLPESPWRNLVIKVAAEDALTSRYPLDSINLLGRIQGLDARRDELYGWAVTAWAREDPDTAMQWVRQINDPTWQQKLIVAALIGKAHHDPQAAAMLAEHYLTDEHAISEANTAIARLWVAKDERAAVQWVDQLPASPAKDQVIKEISSYLDQQ